MKERYTDYVPDEIIARDLEKNRLMTSEKPAEDIVAILLERQKYAYNSYCFIDGEARGKPREEEHPLQTWRLSQMKTDGQEDYLLKPNPLKEEHEFAKPFSAEEIAFIAERVSALQSAFLLRLQGQTEIQEEVDTNPVCI